MNVFFFFFLFFPGDTHYGGWMRMNDRESVKEGEREFVCSDLCSAPHRTYHYQMSQWGWLPAESLLIALNSNSLSLLLSLLLFSLLLSPFFFPSSSSSYPSPSSSSRCFFGARTARAGRVLYQLFSVLRGARRSDPSLLLSLSPLSLLCLSPSLLPLLWQSTPAWSWLHALRVQLPHRPSQPLHSLIPPNSTGFFGSQAHLSSALFASLLLRTGRLIL